MMITRLIPIAILVVLIMLLTAPIASAAQGQITEVNPSGIGVALSASNGRVGDALKNTPASALLKSPSTDLENQGN
jgi:hypothetical protein